MPSDKEWRQILGRPDMPEAELEEFLRGLRRFIGTFLDDYFKEEFEPDEEPLRGAGI